MAAAYALVSEEKGKANHPDRHDADGERQQHIDYCCADAVAENVQASHDEMIDRRDLRRVPIKRLIHRTSPCDLYADTGGMMELPGHGPQKETNYRRVFC
jgi:hypothetical protein